MRRRLPVNGFTVVELLLIIVVITLVGVVGYKIYNTNKSLDRTTSDTEAVLEAPLNNDSLPATIKTADDLGAAEKSLDQLGSSDEDNADFAQLESQLGAF